MPESRENTSGENTSENNEPTITVAEILRTGREKRGQDLRSVASILRIRYVFLEAIERGDFASLPGDTYAYGFVRTYAGYLNLDKDEIVRQFKQEVQNYGDRKQLVFPTPVPESKTPGLAILLTSIVLLGVAYGGWTAISRFDVDISEWVPFLSEKKADTTAEEEASAAGSVDVASTPVESISQADTTVGSSVTAVDAPSSDDTQAENSSAEESIANRAPEAQSQNGQEATETTSTDTVSEAVTVETQSQAVPDIPEVSLTGNAEQGDAAVSEITSEDVTAEDIASQSTSEDDPASTETSVAAVTPPPPPEPEIFGDEVGDSPISIHAERDTWMHIVNGSGEAIFSRVLRAGSVYNVPDQDDLVMATGNAGGITIKLNGNNLPKLGALGAVRRDIILSEEGLLESITAE
ncbi:helix-turn-helix domain-containing protein [Kiloniella sp. EL199]|uniref:helix-turn-helix domain-containing protein n=1 Tax=Kiloniella sp. EL199 TaxID=2107581 RepID=UPI0013C47882|nr:helix-turn-helix domain-containing protein [Kiloniella sp. EL199]